MPCAIIFINSRTPYYDIVIQSNDPDDVGLLRGYAALLCPTSIKHVWNEDDYHKNGEQWITEHSLLVSSFDKLKQFSKRGVAMCMYLHMVHDRIERLGTLEHGIRYFSKYVFSNHRNLSTLSLVQKEKLLINTESMSPQQLLLHYISIINHRKTLMINTNEENDIFCLTPMSSPTNV